MIIPALTLWQPWASLVAVGAKLYETRGKPAPRRLIGQRIAIHAAARTCVTDLPQVILDDISAVLGSNWAATLPRGVVVCTTLLVDSRPAGEVIPDSFGDYGPGRWAWRLDDVRPLSPCPPAKGQQSWGWPWHVPADIEIQL